MNERYPRAGDEVELVIRGVLFNSVHDEELVIRKRARGYVEEHEIHIGDADEVKIVGPQPQPGELWLCLVRGRASPASLYRYEAHSVGPFWQRSDGYRYIGDSEEVTPLRRQFP